MNWNPRENKTLIFIILIIIMITVLTLARIYDWPGFGPGGGYKGP